MDRASFQVDVTDEAREHLKGIAAYIAHDNPTRAKTYARELIQAARELGKDPYAGREYITENKEKLRSITYGSYLILYKILEERKIIEIWAFWHGARKPPKF